MKKLFLFSCFILLPLIIFSAATDSPWLYGIHWYQNTDSISIGETTDVEDMTGSKGVWITEITLIDSSEAAVWDQPAYEASHAQKAAQGKGHSFIYRIQPNWGRNVPHSSDPYTLTDYANDAKSAAETLKDWCHIYQVGNEVNLTGENLYWDGSDYTIQWEPTPAQYADTYIALRDKIREVTPNTTPAEQIVLMQPVSPGNRDTGVGRFVDGNEFLWRQIDAVSDKSKIDGFAIHGYAEPGGPDYGLDGFWDSIREQLMIIDSFGLSDRPVYITEWNKHMPDMANAEIGAKFLHRAFTKMNDWNNGTGGEWSGQPNHNVVTATWFVYPGGGWDDYSLEHWKNGTSSFDEEHDPWKSFQYACGLDYAKGSSGGGATVPLDQMWWEDDFNGSSLDQSEPAPDWRAEPTASGSVQLSGSGSVRLLGNSSLNGGGSIRTAGYVYDDFRFETNFTFTDASRASASGNEANADIRFREGAFGYSLTFFPSTSLVNPGRIILRRTNEWVQIGSYNALVSGGINSGDSFRVVAILQGSDIQIEVYKNGGATPVVDWSITDSEQVAGWIRLMTWNMQELQVNNVKLGGPLWGGASVEDWDNY